MSSLDLRQLHLIASSTHRNALRSGSGIVYVILTVTLGLLVSEAIIQTIDRAVLEIAPRLSGREIPAADEATPEEINAQKREVIERFAEQMEQPLTGLLRLFQPTALGVEESRQWVHYLLQERPALLSLILGFLYAVIPMLLTIGSFDAIAGDVQHRGLRYLLLRTTRGHIFFGRYLGVLGFTLLVMVVLFATVVIYAGGKLPIYGWGELLPWAARGLLGVLMLALPFAALGLLISSAIDVPFAALATSYGAILGVPVLAMSLKGTVPVLGWLLYLLPWGVMPNFLRPGWPPLVVSSLACLAYTAIFLALGAIIFRKRDL